MKFTLFLGVFASLAISAFCGLLAPGIVAPAITSYTTTHLAAPAVVAAPAYSTIHAAPLGLASPYAYGAPILGAPILGAPLAAKVLAPSLAAPTIIGHPGLAAGIYGAPIAAVLRK